MAKCNIGGQAVMEGVMMKSNAHIATAVRNQQGQIVESYQRLGSSSKASDIPFVRGVVNLGQMMKLGIKTLMWSAETAGFEEEEPTRFEKWLTKKTGKSITDVAATVGVTLGIGLFIVLFILLPQLLMAPIRAHLDNRWITNLIEGALRISMFVIYIWQVGRMKEINRVFMYHGAEHKTIACFEAEKDLTVDNVRTFSMAHPRCGTSFMLLVMVLGIIIFAVFDFGGTWIVRFGIRLLLLPIVAGISYEVLKFAAKSDSLLMRIIRWPGMQLQSLTTAEPEDGMLEVAITSFTRVQRLDAGECEPQPVPEKQKETEIAPVDNIKEEKTGLEILPDDEQIDEDNG